MVSASRRARDNRRKRDKDQGTADHDSAMEFEIPDQEDNEQDDNRRRNTSSEDEDEGHQGQLTTRGLPMDPKVAVLVNQATQMIGLSEQDGTAMALAATSAANPADALNLLAASSAMANVRSQRANEHAAQAVVESNLVTRGLTESDYTYDKRFKHYDQELQRLTERVAHLELQRLTDRVAVLESLLGRVAVLESHLGRLIAMLRNGNIDATEVEQMLRNLGI